MHPLFSRKLRAAGQGKGVQLLDCRPMEDCSAGRLLGCRAAEALRRFTNCLHAAGVHSHCSKPKLLARLALAAAICAAEQQMCTSGSGM